MPLITGLIRFCFIITLFTQGGAIRCFECQFVPYPRDCSRITVCNSDEHCFIEQIVTTSGNVVYNSGCLSKSRCSATGQYLIGKRSCGIDRRATDISTCIECCSDNYCNRNGCGAAEIPLGQRGPYCYNCDAVLDPKSCESVAVCMPNEVCMVNVAVEFNGLPETVYRTRCGKRSTCDNMPKGIDSCTGMCCETDFCNIQCINSKNISITTESTQKVVSTTQPTVDNSTTMTTYHTKHLTEKNTTPSYHSPSTTKTPTHCRDHDGYKQLEGYHAHLCVHIVIHHENWDDARSACKKEGGDLVVLNTHEKAQLLRHTLNEDSEYRAHGGYWIGARDLSKNDNFKWVNGHTWHESVADWVHGEPNHHSQDCVVMMHEDSYQWHNQMCSENRNYVCEMVL